MHSNKHKNILELILEKDEPTEDGLSLEELSKFNEQVEELREENLKLSVKLQEKEAAQRIVQMNQQSQLKEMQRKLELELDEKVPLTTFSFSRVSIGTLNLDGDRGAFTHIYIFPKIPFCFHCKY